MRFSAWAAHLGKGLLAVAHNNSPGASRVGAFTLMLPLASAVVGIFWLGEQTGPRHDLALSLVLLGV